MRRTDEMRRSIKNTHTLIITSACFLLINDHLRISYRVRNVPCFMHISLVRNETARGNEGGRKEEEEEGGQVGEEWQHVARGMSKICFSNQNA